VAGFETPAETVVVPDMTRMVYAHKPR
jgi:hypothetical protein